MTQDYFCRFEKEVLPDIKRSAISIAIASNTPDAKQCLEIGAAVLLDKPIIMLVPPGRRVSANLKRCATAIIEGHHDDPETKRRLANAISLVMEKERRSLAKGIQ